MDELYTNTVKEKLKKKGRVSAAWLHLASNVSAEIMANAGFDVLVIDAEHSPVDYQTVLSMCQAIKGTESIPIARAPWNDLIVLKRLLDCGVMGIHVPYVNTREEAQEAVLRCKYPPYGIRGIAGSPRAAGFGLNRGSYLDRANDENLVMIAIETPEGIDNLSEIMEVEGVDGIFIGPMDLSTSLGKRGQLHSKDVEEAIKKIEDMVIPSDKFLGTVADDFEMAKGLYERGYNYIIMMSDAVDMAKLAKARATQFREYCMYKGGKE